jgi:hypothetical protein
MAIFTTYVVSIYQLYWLSVPTVLAVCIHLCWQSVPTVLVVCTLVLAVLPTVLTVCTICDR